MAATRTTSRIIARAASVFAKLVRNGTRIAASASGASRPRASARWSRSTSRCGPVMATSWIAAAVRPGKRGEADGSPTGQANRALPATTSWTQRIRKLCGAASADGAPDELTTSRSRCQEGREARGGKQRIGHEVGRYLRDPARGSGPDALAARPGEIADPECESLVELELLRADRQKRHRGRE